MITTALTVITIGFFCCCFYLEDLYKNPITKPLSQSFWEAVAQTIMIFVTLGLFYIIFK
jgi:hypothetical protein